MIRNPYLMNPWTKLSIEFANQRNYLDELFRVYPMAPDNVRELDEKKWAAVETAFKRQSNTELVSALLKLKLFPIKDSYVAYLKRDLGAIERNPATVDRLAGRLFEMGLDAIWTRCSEPKETNRQIGPLFARWLQKGSLGVPLLSVDQFRSTNTNAVLWGNDAQLMSYAREHLDYRGTKGLDLVARFNGKYVIGEAKFLTDFGGHQNAQFEDAKAVLTERHARAERVAVLDGVLYITGNNKMHKHLQQKHNHNIMSALLLRDFLYQL
ncbi:MAG TPA: hypothetical protein PK098_05400 [Phycisphaerales bacterium]|nr:hypothetical protein [Phycisphaerales bacterium]